ncbi:MAG: helix-turn-helix transcriptional regulator [Deltaproteobacteria bacterium]|nr:helix-turn-helix transcriptional regulator [Deltaproteobacteria bacterium]
MTRSYHQFCGVARALDVVGERWTLLIIRDLLPGPLRFSDLLELEEGIGPNLLTQRLKNLEAHGVLEIRTLPPPGRARVYALTELGMSLRDAVLALGRFGATFMDRPGPSDRLHLGWAMFSLQRRFRGAREGGVVQVVSGELAFVVSFTQENLQVRRGLDDGADARIEGQMPAFGRWLSGAATWRAVESAGGLAVSGRRSVVEALARAIAPRPPRIARGRAR